MAKPDPRRLRREARLTKKGPRRSILGPRSLDTELNGQVGVIGFEPTTPCSQSRCASQTALPPELDPMLARHGPCCNPSQIRFQLYLSFFGGTACPVNCFRGSACSPQVMNFGILGEKITNADELVIIAEMNHDFPFATPGCFDLHRCTQGTPQLLFECFDLERR